MEITKKLYLAKELQIEKDTLLSLTLKDATISIFLLEFGSGASICPFSHSGLSKCQDKYILG